MSISYAGLQLSKEAETSCAGVKDSRYIWRDDLTILQAETGHLRLVAIARSVSLIRDKVLVWKVVSAWHLDPKFSEYIIQGINEGFRLGCRAQMRLKVTAHNLPSAWEHREVVEG